MDYMGKGMGNFMFGLIDNERHQRYPKQDSAKQSYKRHKKVQIFPGNIPCGTEPKSDSIGI